MKPRHFEVLLKLLPTPKQKNKGRKRCDKRSLVTGILQVLKLGFSWNDIHDCSVSDTSCYRYFRELQRRGRLKYIFKLLEQKKTDISECAVDTNSVISFRFNRGVGYDGRHKKHSTKISLLTDKKGLPVDVSFGKGNRHDGSFLSDHLKNTRHRRKKIINLDKIYASLELRRNLRRSGTFVNMETRVNDYIRKIGPKFKLKEDKYKVRFLIERIFAWIENFKRCKYRIDSSLSSYKGFVYLALIIILIRG